MPALLAADVLALVDADFGPAVRAEVEHGARGTGGGGAGGGGRCGLFWLWLWLWLGEGL